MNTDFRNDCISRKIPIVSINTEKFISEFLFSYKPKVCLEIGSAVWYSTTIIAKQIQARNWHIFSFERSYPAYVEGLQNISKNSLNNVSLYPFNFMEIKLERFFLENFDFAFVDWQKSQYGNYLEKIRPLMENNSSVIIDDVIKYHNKLWSLYEFLEKKQINYEILKLEDDDWVMILKK